MSIEVALSKLRSAQICHPSAVQFLIDEAITAIQQAEAKQPATVHLPFGWWFTEDPDVFCMPGSGFSPFPNKPQQTSECIALYTHPAPGVLDDAARYALLRERFNNQKMSACQRIVEDLGLDGDPLDGLDFIVDKDRFTAAQAQKGGA